VSRDRVSRLADLLPPNVRLKPYSASRWEAAYNFERRVDGGVAIASAAQDASETLPQIRRYR
jgi:hypothetical protein